MNNPVRRLLVLLLLAAAGGAFWTWWRERSGQSEPNETPTWPPLDEPVAEPAQAAAASATATAPQPTAPTVPAPTATGAGEATENGEQATWLPPNADGTCPEGFPIKANDNSGIFHLPSGRFYERTKAERCYPSPAAALADGYRQAKS
jgi:hypothetical protein